MGYLIVDAQIKKDIQITDSNLDNQTISFIGKKGQFRRETEYLEQLVKTKGTSIYNHLIVNYHNTYRYVDEEKDLTFRGCLPLNIKKVGKNTVLTMTFNPKEKIDSEYLDFYTKLLEGETKNVKCRK